MCLCVPIGAQLLFTRANYTANEDVGMAVVLITTDVAIDVPLTVTMTTINGSAEGILYNTAKGGVVNASSLYSWQGLHPFDSNTGDQSWVKNSASHCVSCDGRHTRRQGVLLCAVVHELYPS